MNKKDALIIGIFESIGIFPGISRSGSCLAGASAVGLDKNDATDYAFMLFIPAVIGAFVLEAKNIGLIFTLDLKTIICYLAAFLIAMITTYAAFKILLKMIKKGKLFYFAIYSFIVGVMVFTFSAFYGWI